MAPNRGKNLNPNRKRTRQKRGQMMEAKLVCPIEAVARINNNVTNPSEEEEEDNFKHLINTTESAQGRRRRRRRRSWFWPIRNNQVSLLGVNCFTILLVLLNCSPETSSTPTIANANNHNNVQRMPSQTSLSSLLVASSRQTTTTTTQPPPTTRPPADTTMSIMINDDDRRIAAAGDGQEQRRRQVSAGESPLVAKRSRVQVRPLERPRLSHQIELTTTTTTDHKQRKRRQAILSKRDEEDNGANEEDEDSGDDTTRTNPIGLFELVRPSSSSPPPPVIVRRSSEQQQQVSIPTANSTTIKQTSNGNHSDEHRHSNDQASQSRLMELKQKYMTNRAINDRAYYILLIIYSLFITFGTISNSLICLTVILKPKILSPRNIFIVNLAGSDLLLCVFTMPFSFIEISMKAWQMGLIPCKLVAGLQATSIFVSTISITAIAVDRYKVIVYPTHQEAASGTRGAALILACVWFVALLLSLPLFYFRTIEHFSVAQKQLINYRVDFCIEAWPLTHGRGIYSVISMIFQYVLPITIVSVVYAKISDKLQKRLIRRQRLTQLECQQKRQLNLIRRTHTMLVSVSLVFGLSWLPLNLLNVISDFSPLFPQDDQLFRIVFAICHLIGCSSACSNPILYGFLNENFRKEFHQVYTHHARMLAKHIRSLLNCLGLARSKSEPVDQLEDERFQDQINLYSHQSNSYSSASSTASSTSNSDSSSSTSTSDYDSNSTSSTTSSSSDGGQHLDDSTDEDRQSPTTSSHQDKLAGANDNLRGNSFSLLVKADDGPAAVNGGHARRSFRERLGQHSLDIGGAQQPPNHSPNNNNHARHLLQIDSTRRFSFQTVTSGKQTFGKTMRFCLCISGSSSIETLGCVATPNAPPGSFRSNNKETERQQQLTSTVIMSPSEQHNSDTASAAGQLDDSNKQLSIVEQSQQQQLAKSERLEPIVAHQKQQQQQNEKVNNLNEINEAKQQNVADEEKDRKLARRIERRRKRAAEQRDDEQADEVEDEEHHNALKLNIFDCECKCHQKAMKREAKRTRRRRKKQKHDKKKRTDDEMVRMAAEAADKIKKSPLPARRASRSGSIVNELLSNVRWLTQSATRANVPSDCSIGQNNRLGHQKQRQVVDASKTNEATKVTTTKTNHKRGLLLLKKVAEEREREQELEEACKRIEQDKQVRTKFSCLRGLSDDFDDQNNNRNGDDGVFATSTTTTAANNNKQAESNRMKNNSSSGGSIVIKPISGRRVWLRLLGSSSSAASGGGLGCQNSIRSATNQQQKQREGNKNDDEHSLQATTTNDDLLLMKRNDDDDESKRTTARGRQLEKEFELSVNEAKPRLKSDNEMGPSRLSEPKKAFKQTTTITTTKLVNIKQQMHSFDRPAAIAAESNPQSNPEPKRGDKRAEEDRDENKGRRRRAKRKKSKKERHCDNCKHNYQTYKEKSPSSLFLEKQRSLSKRLKQLKSEMEQNDNKNNASNSGLQSTGRNSCSSSQQQQQLLGTRSNSSMNCREQQKTAATTTANSTTTNSSRKSISTSKKEALNCLAQVKVGTCYLSVDLNRHSRANSDLSLSRERSTSVVILGCDDMASMVANDSVDSVAGGSEQSPAAPPADSLDLSIEGEFAGDKKDSPSSAPAASGIEKTISLNKNGEQPPIEEDNLLEESGDQDGQLNLDSSRKNNILNKLTSPTTTTTATTTNSSSTNSMICSSNSMMASRGNLFDDGDDCDASSAGSLCTCTASSSCHSMSSSRGADESMGSSSALGGHSNHLMKTQRQQRQQQSGGALGGSLGGDLTSGIDIVSTTTMDEGNNATATATATADHDAATYKFGGAVEKSGQNLLLFGCQNKKWLNGDGFQSKPNKIEVQKSSCSLSADLNKSTTTTTTTTNQEKQICTTNQSSIAANQLSFSSSFSLANNNNNGDGSQTADPRKRRSTMTTTILRDNFNAGQLIMDDKNNNKLIEINQEQQQQQQQTRPIMKTATRKVLNNDRRHRHHHQCCDRNPLELRQLSHSSTVLVVPNRLAEHTTANKLTSNINLTTSTAMSENDQRIGRSANRRHHQHNSSINCGLRRKLNASAAATTTATTSSCSSTFATTTTTSRSSLNSELTCSSADQSPPPSRGSANSLPSTGIIGGHGRGHRVFGLQSGNNGRNGRFLYDDEGECNAKENNVGGGGADPTTGASDKLSVQSAQKVFKNAFEEAENESFKTTNIKIQQKQCNGLLQDNNSNN